MACFAASGAANCTSTVVLFDRHVGGIAGARVHVRSAWRRSIVLYKKERFKVDAETRKLQTELAERSSVPDRLAHLERMMTILERMTKSYADIFGSMQEQLKILTREMAMLRGWKLAKPAPLARTELTSKPSPITDALTPGESTH